MVKKSMTMSDVVERAERRWGLRADKIKPSEVELIGEERLHTPLQPGERVTDRWLNNFQAVG